MSRGGAVLLVTDEVRAPHCRALASKLGLSITHVDELTQHMLADFSGLVFDVDLRSVELVRRLKGLLGIANESCRIFIVDPDVRVTDVHAKVLGAHATLPITGPARDVQAALHKHFSQQNSETRLSIDAGINALDLTFRALSSNGTLETASVLEAGERIAGAIVDEGTEQWLETVKGYHMGTFQHCMLVTGVAAGFGARTGMAKRDIVTLTITGLLHDIGKAATPVEILDKPGALSEGEMAILRRHPVTGADYLKSRSSVDSSIRSAVRFHHEMLDGTGYPDGLSGGEIDDLTRILTICDIYAALVERRAYKPAKRPEDAILVLEAMAGVGKVEADLVRALKRIVIS